LRGFSFTDTNVSEGIWYYYKVKPSLEGSIVSTFNAAQTFQVPTPAERITSLTLPHAAQKVRIAGNYAYVAAGAQGLLVVDISDPAAPVYLRAIGTTNAKDLVIQGSYLYLADGAGASEPLCRLCNQRLHGRCTSAHGRGRGFVGRHAEPPVRDRRLGQYQPAPAGRHHPAGRRPE
jgi:hypothetical protein